MWLLIVRIWGRSVVLVSAMLFPATGWTGANSSAPEQHSAADVRIQLGAPVKFKVGQTASLVPGNIQVKLLNVVEDSRCPKGVSCIQAGQVTVVFSAFHKDEKRVPKTVRITSRAAQTQPAKSDFGEYVMTLLEVQPYPVHNRKIIRSDYTVTIRLRKK